MLYLPRATLAAICAIALSGSPVRAEPAASVCAVELVRVPDDVRGVVEAWIRAEPRCSHALEVRIVPTDGGLYVLARDDAGRFHERVVPDATSAGALIVSWAADDGPGAGVPSRGPRDATAPSSQSPQNAATPWAAPTRTVAVPPSATAAVPSARAAAPPQTATVPPASAAAASLSAGAAPASDRDRARPDLLLATAAPRASAPIAPASPRWISAAWLFGVADRGAAGGESLSGGRVGLDLWTSGQWTIGAAATVARSERKGYRDSGTGYLFDTLVRSFDASAVLRAGLTARFGAWELTPAIGAGLLYSNTFLQRAPELVDMPAISAIGETSLTAAYRVSRRLAIATGAVATGYVPIGGASRANATALHVDRTGGIAVIEGLWWAL